MCTESDSSELLTPVNDSVSSLGSQHVLAGETCPNPKTFPFPVSGEVELLHKKFRSLVIDTINAIQLRFELCDLISTLQRFLKNKWYFSPVCTQDEAVDRLGSLQSFDDVVLYLLNQQYCSWFDYELIEDLRNEFLFTKNSSKHDSVLSDYKANFKIYASRRCFTTKNTGQHDKPIKEVEVICKTDLHYDQLSCELIKHLKHFFTNILGASKYSLCFKQAREGCIELIFIAPPYFGKIHQLSKYQKSQLKAHGFLKVIIMEQNLLEVDSEVRLRDTGKRVLKFSCSFN